jgi:hypothetical protein
MFRTVGEELWVFDIEWVPDPVTGRRAHGLADDVPDADVIARMFEAAGATPEHPRPFIKTALCRVVSISAIKRRATGSHPVRLELRSMPEAGESALDEAVLIANFLESAGKVKPQLVGFNITGADIPILVQRAMAHGIAAPAFCQRPEKPWQGVDYFGGRGSDAIVELMDVYGTWGRGTPSLHELASAAGIPGKLDALGEQVLDFWQAGDMRRIVEYNEFDVITTYLIWLRTAHLAGFVSGAAYEAEERQLEALLRDRVAAGAKHLERYLERWSPARAAATRAT